MDVGDVTSIANTFAWIVISLAFMRGSIMSTVVVDKMLLEAENRTLKLVNELQQIITKAVKQGFLEANKEMQDQEK